MVINTEDGSGFLETLVPGIFNTIFSRYKWRDQLQEPKIGDMVLIKEDDLPPSRWLYGIITDKHPGLDNLTRVVSLRCKGNTIIKRPISKLCILPVTY